jgi:hypothetical protein
MASEREFLLYHQENAPSWLSSYEDDCQTLDEAKIEIIAFAMFCLRLYLLK